MRRRDEVLVGILMTTAITVAVVGTLWLVRGGLSSGYPLYARFPWGQGLRTGQPVLLAGITVGTVDQIRLDRSGSGSVVVRLRINERELIPSTSTAAVKPNGIFGDMLVALQPTRSTPESFTAGDTVPTGPAEPSMEVLLRRLDTMSTNVRDVTQAFEMQLVRGGGIEDFRQTLAQTNRFVTQLSAIAAEQSRQMSLTMATFRRSVAAVDSARLDSVVRNMEATSANLTRLTTTLTETSTELNQVVTKINSGTGSLGRLVNDTTLYSNMRNLLARVDSLTADFQKHPRKYINLEIF